MFPAVFEVGATHAAALASVGKKNLIFLFVSDFVFVRLLLQLLRCAARCGVSR